MVKREKSSALCIEDNERYQEEVGFYKEKPLEAGFIHPELTNDGIGVENFLQGKVIFITGATGFFGKVLIEKILRSMPNVSKLYLMIRAKDKEVAEQRLKNEIVDIELFKCLKQKYGEHYEAFMLSKLVPVVGNIGDSNLGMKEELAIEIAKDVQIIVNSAGDTAFQQRYDAGLEINAIGPCNLMDFAKKCKNLVLFMHISTSKSHSVKRYSREGRIMEGKVWLRDSMERETFISEATLLEKEVKLASDYKKNFKDNYIAAQKMKELGLKRAKEYGWQNTYGFTKALGEMLIDKMRGEIPVLILRPSGISSTYKEPFPGWIEGNKLVDPVILYYGKGKLTGFPLNPNCLTDLVPADIVVNATLAAMAKHVLTAKKANINFYHVCSSTSNPLVNEDLCKLIYQHFKSSPCIDSNGRPIQVSEMKFFGSMQDFSAQLWREVALPNQFSATTGSNAKLFEIIKFKERLEHLGTIYMPYTFHSYWFDDINIQGLIKSMSEEEKKKFGCDVKSIEWKDYIVNVHIPGLRRHILKEKGLSKM